MFCVHPTALPDKTPSFPSLAASLQCGPLASTLCPGRGSQSQTELGSQLLLALSLPGTCFADRMPRLFSLQSFEFQSPRTAAEPNLGQRSQEQRPVHALVSPWLLGKSCHWKKWCQRQPQLMTDATHNAAACSHMTGQFL